MCLISGNTLVLGQAENGRELHFSAEARATHLYCCGGTGTGKSKFLENLIRQDIKNWSKSKCGLLLLDPHGSLYDSLMSWAAWNNLDRPIVPIDLRRDDWVIAYNVLRQRKVADPAVIVNNFVQAMAYVWGQAGTTETPLFARWAANIMGTLYEKQLTLLEAEYLMDRVSKGVRQAMTERLENRSAAKDWAYANSLSPKDFEMQISSTVNRLHSFLSTRAMRQMFGQSGVSLDLAKSLEEGHIILVSLATERGRVSDEDASLFATLLLSDLWTAAKERGKGDVKPFYCYLDEFQRFVTPTIAQNLDEARGFGLHLTLAHQFPNQLLHTGPHGKQVYDSVMVNARSKVVFGLEGEENLKPLAQSLFMGAMDPEKIKLSLYSTKVMDYVEETRTIRGKGKSKSAGGGSQRGSAGGQGEGGTDGYSMEMGMFGQVPGEQISHSDSTSRFHSASESENDSWSEAASSSESEVPFLQPIMGKELSSVQYVPLEEQLFKAMAVLFDQQQRHAVTRIVGSRLPVKIKTPTVLESVSSPERVLRFTNKLYEKLPFALKAPEAERLLKERESTIETQLVDLFPTDEASDIRKKLK